MKNTKRILIFIGAVVLLASMVFAVAAAAADSAGVTAGSDTSYDEYLNMKLVVSHGFEAPTNAITYYLGNQKKNVSLANRGDAKNGDLAGMVQPVNNIWQSISGVYSDEYSSQFYMINYNYNDPEGHLNDDGSRRPGDLYIQPIFGVYDDVEKTPKNGFVSEFDIAFFSEVVYVMTEKLDENGEVVMTEKTDGAGRVIYEVETDENGETLYELMVDEDGFYVQAYERDAEGNIVYQKDEFGNDLLEEGNKVPVLLYKKDADGNYVLDEKGKQIPVYETLKDSQGNPIPKYVCAKDENGNPMYETKTVTVDGESVEEVKTYDNGNPIPVKIAIMVPVMTYVYEDLLVPLTDENGNTLFNEDGSMKYLPEYVDSVDAEGNPVKVEKKDENGNIVYVKRLDENGQPIQVRKVDPEKSGTFTGLGDKSFGIGMYNTVTLKDGKIDLMSFKTNAETRTVTLYAGGKAVHTFHADEWEHISIQYDAESMLTSVYVGKTTRKCVYTIKATAKAENQNNEVVNVYPLQFRMGGQIVSGLVGIDNLLAYQGTTIHDPEYLTKMTDDEKFIFSSINTLGNTEEGANNRLQAYNEIEKNIISNYYDFVNGKITFGRDNANYDKLVESVNIFLSYKENEIPEGETTGKYDALIEAVKAENALSFKALVDNIGDVSRSFATLNEISSKINMAENFVTKSGDYLDFSSTVYTEANGRLQTYKANLESDKASQQFIVYMNVFKKSYEGGASAARLQAHYEVAAALRDAVSNPDELENETDKKNLKSAITRFDGSSTTTGAAELIRLKTVEYNSSRFVGMMSLLSSTSNGNWAESGESARKLWELALAILNENMYDEEYEGFLAAKSVFDSLNSYFWEVRQQEHLLVIREKLDGFNDPEASYVFKKAICLYVDNYIADNSGDMDTEHKEIAAEIVRNESYKAQLSTLELDYKSLLVQNATKFINTIKYASEFTSYKDLKPLYDEASEYYYAMDLIGEDIDSYVAKYEEIREYVTKTEQACELFLAASAQLSTASDREKLYGLLVQCYSCLDDLDISYDGIKEAKVVYTEAYNEYSAVCDAVNEDIKTTVDLAGAVRGNWDIDGIVAFFVNLFN